MLQQGPGAGKFAGTEDNNHFRGKKRGSVFFLYTSGIVTKTKMQHTIP